MIMGFYGKMPGLGDFVTRGLPRPLVAELDAWLASGLIGLRSDPAWLEHYLVAPVWRFVVPHGVWGEAMVGGALMPSVDGVGRYFPLIVAGAWGAGVGPDLGAVHALLAELGARMPAVLQHRIDADAWGGELARLGAGAPSHTAPSPFMPDVLSAFTPSGGRSAWWAAQQAEAPLLQVSHRGRPDDELFRLLFRGYAER